MFGVIRSEYNYRQFTCDKMARDFGRHAFDRAPGPGDRAPEFAVRSLTGDSIALGGYRGKKNVVLTFGSATCPMTAGSMAGINELFKRYRGGDVEFLFVYVREAHPGDKIAAHGSMADKVCAAKTLEAQENLRMSVLVDDLKGSIHRKYGTLPNPTYLIDKSGRIAFRMQWTQAAIVEEALQQLLKIQRERGLDHAVVLGGEDCSMPVSYPMLYSYRALERGGPKAIADFEQSMGLGGRIMVAGSRLAGPMMGNPGKSMAVAALAVGVVAAALYAGKALRKRRMASRHPYDRYVFESPQPENRGTDDPAREVAMH